MLYIYKYIVLRQAVVTWPGFAFVEIETASVFESEVDMTTAKELGKASDLLRLKTVLVTSVPLLCKVLKTQNGKVFSFFRRAAKSILSYF